MRPEHWLFTIPLRLRSLFRWAQADQELDDELREHLNRKTEEYIAQGMAPEEAHRRARLDLGGIEQTKEKCRDARRVNWIQDFVQDLRFGLHVAQVPGVHRNCHRHAGAGHWREHRNIFRGQYGAAAPAAGEKSLAVGSAGVESERAVRPKPPFPYVLWRLLHGGLWRWPPRTCRKRRLHGMFVLRAVLS